MCRCSDIGIISNVGVQMLNSWKRGGVQVSKRSYPAHFSKEDKRALRKRVQHFACTEDGELYSITSVGLRVSVHVNSKIVYIQNLCSTRNLDIGS